MFGRNKKRCHEKHDVNWRIANDADFYEGYYVSKIVYEGVCKSCNALCRKEEPYSTLPSAFRHIIEVLQVKNNQLRLCVEEIEREKGYENK